MTRKLLFLAAAFLLLGAPAFGGLLTFTLSPSLEIGTPGGSVTFQGTISSSVDNYCCLNSIETSFGEPGDTYLSVDLSGLAAFWNVPTILFAGDPFDDAYTGPIFDILIAPNTPAGLYSGTVTILGSDDGYDFSALDPLVSQDFQVDIAPEPGMPGLTLAGLATLAAIARRRRVL